MADFDRVANIYDATRKEPDVVMRATLDVMQNALEGCKRVLDVGVGTGRFAKPLLDRGFSIVGVDVSRQMMAKAAMKGARELVQGDAHYLPFHDESFDAAIFILFLHLVPDWPRAVREIGRICEGPVISLVGSDEGPSVRRAYLKLREEAGYPLRRLNDDAEGLRRVIPPSKVYLIMNRVVETSADDSIEYFRSRGSSLTWSVPASVHDKIVESLRSSFGGRVLRQKVVDELAVWDAHDFRAYGVNP